MNRDLIDPWLVLGSSLYWSAVVLSFAFGGVSISPAADSSETAFAYVGVAAIIVCFLPLRFLFEHRRNRRVVALAMATIVALYVAANALPGVPPLALKILSLAYLIEVASQMLFWGFAYASFDKSRACQNVSCTILVVVVLVSVMSLVFKATGVSYLTCFLNIASLLVVASGRVYFSSRDREAEKDARRPLTSFICSRVAYGFFIGFCMQLPGSTDVQTGETWFSVFAALACLAVLLFYLGLRAQLSASLPVSLVAGICLLYLPYLEGGYSALASSAAGFVWLAWATMSAAQLSELKETCGMREFTLCVIEKAMLCVAIVCGSAACFALGLLGMDPNGPSIRVLVIGGLFVLVLIAAFTMSRLLDSRQQDELARRLADKNKEATSAFYKRMADEYKLSDREAEVLALLGEGYSRTHIREALGVSEGTIKAHVSHVYQKLGIHSKDELLDMVEALR